MVNTCTLIVLFVWHMVIFSDTYMRTQLSQLGYLYLFSPPPSKQLLSIYLPFSVGLGSKRSLLGNSLPPPPHPPQQLEIVLVNCYLLFAWCRESSIICLSVWIGKPVNFHCWVGASLPNLAKYCLLFPGNVIYH